MWTLFWDMHSGGGKKEPPYDNIYIESDEETAKVIFYNRFGHSPQRVSCTCCGEDYSIYESETLESASGFHRGCKWDEKNKEFLEGQSNNSYDCRYATVEEYIARPDVLVIRESNIKPEERIGDVPEEGFVWR